MCWVDLTSQGHASSQLEILTPSDRNLRFNLPAVFPELVCSFFRFRGIHIDEEEIIPVVAVNPGQSDHGRAPGCRSVIPMLKSLATERRYYCTQIACIV